MKVAAPPIRSECPPMYLLQLLKDTSAPSSKGDCKYGEQKVLSTIILMLELMALVCLTISLMSMSFMVGLVGVSIQIIFVEFLIALTRFLVLVKSTN